MMKNGVKKAIGAAAYPLALVLLLWAAWAFAAARAGSEFILPSPGSTVAAFFALLSDRSLYLSLAFTLVRALVTFTLSALAAGVLALAGTNVRWVDRLMSPIVSVTRALPTMAAVLLIAIWVGRNAAPVVVAALVVMPTLYAAFRAALSGVERDAIDMARLDGAGRLTLILRFYMPLSLPATSLPAATTLSLTVKLMVAAEVLSSTAGSLGMMMQRAALYFMTARLLALTVLAVIVSVALEKLLYFLLRLPWRSWK